MIYDDELSALTRANAFNQRLLPDSEEPTAEYVPSEFAELLNTTLDEVENLDLEYVLPLELVSTCSSQVGSYANKSWFRTCCG